MNSDRFLAAIAVLLALSACAPNRDAMPMPTDEEGLRRLPLSAGERERLQMYYDFETGGAKTIGEALAQAKAAEDRERVERGLTGSEQVMRKVDESAALAGKREAWRRDLKVWLVSRELTDRKTLEERRQQARDNDDDGLWSVPYGDGDNLLITTFQVENLGERTITRYEGTARVFEGSTWRYECRLESDERTLPPRATRDVRCVTYTDGPRASGGEMLFARLPATALRVQWDADVQDVAPATP